MDYKDIPQFPQAYYSVDIPWDYLEDTLKRYNEGGVLQLDPEFQRLHVWTREQQIAFIEFRLMGGTGGENIYFSQADWGMRYQQPMYLVDGKQRLEAVRAFMRSEIPVFGVLRKDFTGYMPIFQAKFKFHVATLRTTADVIQWYIGLNAGGTDHTNDEIEKAKRLLEGLQ